MAMGSSTDGNASSRSSVIFSSESCDASPKRTVSEFFGNVSTGATGFGVAGALPPVVGVSGVDGPVWTVEPVDDGPDVQPVEPVEPEPPVAVAPPEEPLFLLFAALTTFGA